MIDSKMLGHIIHQQIGTMDIADLAANDTAKVDMTLLKICDREHPEITVGWLLVAACYGSEKAIRQVQTAISNAEGATKGKESGE